MSTATADRSWRSYRSEYASLTRSRKPGHPDLIEARRNMRAAKLAEYIERTVSEAPPLTPEQRDRLAELLRAGGGNAAA